MSASTRNDEEKDKQPRLIKADVDAIINEVKILQAFYVKKEGGLFSKKKHSGDIKTLVGILEGEAARLEGKVNFIEASKQSPKLSEKEAIKSYEFVRDALQLKFDDGLRLKKSGGTEKSFVDYLNKKPEDSHYYRQLGLLLQTMYRQLGDTKSHPDLIELKNPHAETMAEMRKAKL